MQNKEVLNNNQLAGDEFDLKLFLNFVLRNKIFIGIFSISFFFLSYLYSLTIKRVWEGQFQIVLTSEDSNLSNLSPLVKRFVSKKKGNDLTTQVGILKSPSVLMPIFNYVKLEKKKINEGHEMSFLNWEKNLNIDLEDGTSILNISYQDTYKDLIIPALNKMSSRYQEYSGKKVKRQQELTRDFLLDQVDKYRNKSFESLKRVQEYAIDQDLIFFQGGSSEIKTENNIGLSGENNIGLSGENLFLPNIKIESARVRAANEIRNIDSQLKKIQEMENVQDIVYVANTIPNLVKKGLPNQLAEINNQLSYSRTKFKEKDIIIKNLLDKRDALIRVNRDSVVGFLKAKRTQAESTLEATSRPKGVLIRYKELIREASRDENTLILLENRLRENQLDSARRSDPWELISKPILLKNPVAPSRRKISFVGFIIGFIFGSFIAYFRERKLNLLNSNK